MLRSELVEGEVVGVKDSTYTVTILDVQPYDKYGYLDTNGKHVRVNWGKYESITYMYIGKLYKLGGSNPAGDSGKAATHKKAAEQITLETERMYKIVTHLYEHKKDFPGLHSITIYKNPSLGNPNAQGLYTLIVNEDAMLDILDSLGK